MQQVQLWVTKSISGFVQFSFGEKIDGGGEVAVEGEVSFGDPGRCSCRGSVG